MILFYFTIKQKIEPTLILLPLTTTPYMAANAEGLAMNVEAPVKEKYLANTQLPIPSNMRLVKKQEVMIDKTEATLLRFERKDDKNSGLMGEHFSTLLDKEHRLKGFTDMTLKAQNGVLPSEAEAESIARDFLKTHAPDLLPTIEISWIKPHDEVIYNRSDNQKTRPP